jgi:hypothetical protein
MSATKLDWILLPEEKERFPMSSIVVDGQAWDVTTNGRAIAFVQAVTATYPEPPRGMAKDFVRFLENPSDEPRRMSLSTILHVVGDAEPSRSEECRYCCGSGLESDADDGCECRNCLCGWCAGDGEVWTSPKAREALFDGVPVDANLIAVTLAAIAPNDDVVSFWTDKKEKRIRFAGYGWRAVVMGIHSAHAGSPELLNGEAA